MVSLTRYLRAPTASRINFILESFQAPICHKILSQLRKEWSEYITPEVHCAQASGKTNERRMQMQQLTSKYCIVPSVLLFIFNDENPSRCKSEKEKKVRRELNVPNFNNHVS